MRIVRVANFVTPASGGLRTALRSLGAGFVAAGHDVALVIPGPRDSRVTTEHGQVIMLRGPRVPFLGGYRVLLSQRRVMSVLAGLRPDVLEVSDRTTLRWTGRWAAAHGIATVMVSHESAAALLSRFLGNTPARFQADFLADFLNRRTAAAYDRVVCTTSWAAAEFRRIGASNLVQVPLGVDLSVFARSAASGRSPLAWSPVACDEGVLLVHCGRLSPEKEPQRSLRTLAGVLAAGVPARLAVAGDGPLRSRLERMAANARLPVRFLGHVASAASLASLLASADVMIAPGPAETFGLAAVEALACGTPVVCSAASALPEVVGPAGVAVAGDDLSAGVLEVLRWPEASRRTAARARAAGFSWEASVAAFLDVYSEVVR